MDSPVNNMIELSSSSERSASPSLRVNIPEHGLTPPVALPSPVFDGGNEDINTEPFPAFEDLTDESGILHSLTPDHCELHCEKKVCRHQRRLRWELPDCTCPYDEFLSPAAPLSTRPPLILYALDEKREAQEALLSSRTADFEVEIDYEEAIAILQNLTIETIAHRLRDDGFMESMYEAASDDEAEITVATMTKFCDTMTLYFDRTVRLSGSRVVTLRQLVRELKVHVWTMLKDWVEEHGTEDQCERILCFSGTECLQEADEGAPAIVLDILLESLVILVETLVWRGEEVKQHVEGVKDHDEEVEHYDEEVYHRDEEMDHLDEEVEHHDDRNLVWEILGIVAIGLSVFASVSK